MTYYPENGVGWGEAYDVTLEVSRGRSKLYIFASAGFRDDLL